MASDITNRAVSNLTMYCDSMGIPLPPLEYEDHELVMSDDLLQFVIQEGMSLDWLCRNSHGV